MLDVGWTELVVIAVVLIIVVGPKDLPPMLRTFGRMMTKMRGMANDFRQQFDEALKEADLDDVRQTLSDAQKLNPANTLREAMNPLRQMGNEIKADLQKATTPDAKPEAAPEPAVPEPVPAAPVMAPPPAVSTPAPVAAVEAPVEKPKRMAKPKVAVAAPSKPVGKKTSAKVAETDAAAPKPRTRKTTAQAKKTGDA